MNILFKTNKELKYGIKIFYNVFSKKERLKILNQFKPLLRKVDNYPGLQTDPNLHIICNYNSHIFNPFIEIKKRTKIVNSIYKSWINYTDSELKYLSWHDHMKSPYDKTCAYMLENPEKIGTWFLIEDKIYKVKCPTNSLILFSKNLIHSVPYDIEKPRYSLAIDFM